MPFGSRRTEDDEPLFASVSYRNSRQRLSTRSIRRIVKVALRQCGLDSARLSAHSLRHTAVTLSLQGGASPQEAQAMARHSSIETTMIYAHNIDRIAHAPERRIAALLKGHGVGKAK
ncbi:MAG: tyrosine-type recombinase/integrase [bacterium]|nr:tyrosine-type recombinase/integrase [bacterium]